MPYLSPHYLLIPVLALSACTKPWAPTHEYTCPDGYAFTIAYSATDNPGDIAILEDADGKPQLVTMSIRDSVKFWVDRNQCGPEVTSMEIPPREGSSLTRKSLWVSFPSPSRLRTSTPTPFSTSPSRAFTTIP